MDIEDSSAVTASIGGWRLFLNLTSPFNFMQMTETERYKFLVFWFYSVLSPSVIRENKLLGKSKWDCLQINVALASREIVYYSNKRVGVYSRAAFINIFVLSAAFVRGREAFNRIILFIFNIC